MTTPETDPGAARGSGLTADELAALKPHVINLRRGLLSEGPGALDGEYSSTADDVRAIFTTHLPAFLAERKGPVPLLVNAHGGLVTEASGLRAAAARIPWWTANGIYPVFFVWETGLVSSLADVLAGWLGGSRGPGDIKDRIVELAARFGQGERVWGQMKEYARAASADGGGASFFADQLGTFMTDNPGALTVHAVGHSAGSIFHSHFIPVALKAGVRKVETVSLLAPAVRTDLFKATLLREVDAGIGKLSMFTMTDELERADNCVRVYGKSLLYLVRAAFEPGVGDPILGLQDSVRADAELREWFAEPGSESSAEVVWAHADQGPFSSTDASSHGAFDDDPATMESVMRRVLGRKDIQPMPVTRGAEALWPAQPRTASLDTWPGNATKKALCVGINAYERPDDRLNGCVADAGTWGTELEKLGFAVHSLTDAEATREGILLKILELVSTSTAGDTLVVQYAGHGTTAPDLDGDEAATGQGRNQEDEALCPVDFRSGELIIDDDLGRIWDVLPEDVSLTLFFDSCHSGTARREIVSPAELEALTTAKSLPRRVVLGDEDRERFRARRGHGRAASAEMGSPTTEMGSRVAEMGSPTTEMGVLGAEIGASVTLTTAGASPSSSVDRYRAAREVQFAACAPDELAYETAGHGDFTSKAAPLLAEAAGAVTNAEFLARVVDGFDKRQHPGIYASDEWHSRTFLGAIAGAQAPTSAVQAPTSAAQAPTSAGMRADDAELAALDLALTGEAAAAGHRSARVAALLRAIADVIEG
ncbi:caspase family protein [Sinomonas mesophila]|uniref:caspase family protein n=1 Tax=Sinomonas mesophila TaxID=1531955 RepID=UPI000986AC4F|nr:caspase family protein [Sinomonas mesophila]